MPRAPGSFHLNLEHAWYFLPRPFRAACAEAATALSEEHGFQLYRSWGSMLRGWAMAATGTAEVGIDLMRRGFEDLEVTGAVLGRPSLPGLLADAYRRSARGGAACAG